MDSTYQEPIISSGMNGSWINEADLEEGLVAHPQSNRRDLGHDIPRPQFSIPTHNGAPMFPSSPSTTDSESIDTRSISPPQASYQPPARNGSVRMGYGDFDPALGQGRTPRKASFGPSHVNRGDYTLSPSVISS